MAETALRADPLIKALHAAYCRGAPRRELLQMTAEKIRASGEPYTSVYLYMLDGDELVLEAHSGRDTDLTSIPVGSGLCGKAVAEKRDINAPDVSAEAEYLSCSMDTKAELVMLIRRGDEILGQIDIDSDTPAGFTVADEIAVRRVADGLASLL